MGWDGMGLFGDKLFAGFDGRLNFELDAFQFGTDLEKSFGDFGGEQVGILTVHSPIPEGFGSR